MELTPLNTEYTDAVADINATIIDQNRRFDLLDAINDDDIRTLAKAGITSE